MPKGSFTCDVMWEMARHYPGHTFFLLLGGDAFARMARWKHIEEIRGRTVIGVLLRGKAETRLAACRKAEMELTGGADIRIFDAPTLRVSSSTIRAGAVRGESIHELVSLPSRPIYQTMRPLSRASRSNAL